MDNKIKYLYAHPIAAVLLFPERKYYNAPTNYTLFPRQ